VRDVTHSPPSGWSLERRLEYLEWSRRVVAGCRGVHGALERLFDEVLSSGLHRINEASSGSWDALD
jgi:guanosine-3',5'-bis(diphosphate) 3'-pyrophosphohydrolase